MINLTQEEIRVVLISLRDRITHQNHLYRVHKAPAAKQKAKEALAALQKIEQESGAKLEAIGGSAALAATMPPAAP